LRKQRSSKEFARDIAEKPSEARVFRNRAPLLRFYKNVKVVLGGDL